MPAASSPRSHHGLRGIDLADTVVVTLGARAATPADDHRALAQLVARLAGVGVASVSLQQRCPHCGAADHGALRVHLVGQPDATATATVRVSLARAGGRLALAVTAAGPVGIDVESVAALGRAPVDDVLLSPAEAQALAGRDPRAATADLAVLWTAKEAVLKAAGVGLRVDPRELTVTLDPAGVAAVAGSPGQPTLADWPAAPFPVRNVHLVSVPAPVGSVATVAVVCAERPRLLVMPVGAR